MQPGCIVECVESFYGTYKAHLALYFFNIPCPEKGKQYLVDEVLKCSCKKHDNLILDYTNQVAWDARHFREVLPPEKISIDEIIKSPNVKEQHDYSRRDVPVLS